MKKSMIPPSPEITIGMPVYNGEKYIREALDSLLGQTFRNFELIISDNASTDGTQAICQSYLNRDSRIRYVRQSENLGALNNFCFVLKEAQAQYFMWAACDDTWSTEWVDRLLKKVQGKEKCAAFGTLQHIDAESRHLQHRANLRTYNYPGQSLRGRVRYFLDFEGLGKANLFYALYPTTILRSFNFSSYDTDYLILFDLLKKTSFLPEKEPILYKRIHSSSEAAGQGIQIRTRRERLKILLSFSWLQRDYLVSKRYIDQSAGFERAILLFLIPLKIFNSLPTRLLRGLEMRKAKATS